MESRRVLGGALVALVAVILWVGAQGEPLQPRVSTAPWSAAPTLPPSIMSRPGPVPTAPGKADPTATPGVSSQSLPTPAQGPSDSVPLREEIANFVTGLDGTYSVAISDLTTGQQVLVDAARVFPSASLYKVLVMYRVYQLIDRGELSPNTEVVFLADDLAESENGDGLSPGDEMTVDQAVEWMITFSSNPAAYALARKAGGWNEVLAAADELGMRSTTWDGASFQTTSADMLRFFELLGRRALVSPTASDEMIGVLLRQTINDRLPADLPPGTRVAHKTGELPEIRHDGGIVFTPNGPYAIVIMSEGIDPPKAAAAQATIARMAYDRVTSGRGA